MNKEITECPKCGGKHFVFEDLDGGGNGLWSCDDCGEEINYGDVYGTWFENVKKAVA